MIIFNQNLLDSDFQLTPPPHVKAKTPVLKLRCLQTLYVPSKNNCICKMSGLSPSFSRYSQVSHKM